MLPNNSANFLQKYMRLPPAHKIIIEALVENFLLTEQPKPEPRPAPTPPPALKNTLWKIADIAEFFAMSRTTTEQKIISCPDFPRPFSINSTQPRWIPEEVIKFAERKRG